jgi:hypothetical protein
MKDAAQHRSWTFYDTTKLGRDTRACRTLRHRRDLTRSLSPTEMLDGAILKVPEHFKVAAVRIHLMDEAEKCLELVAYKGIAKGPVGRTASNWGH